jgi:predicted RNA binding protein YcfA (HicA-like mRNA interferase family)
LNHTGRKFWKNWEPFIEIKLIEIATDFHLTKKVICVLYTRVKSSEIIKIIEENGWILVAQKGSHLQYKHPLKTGRVTIPHPKKDIPKGTVNSIFKQAGIKEQK